MTTGHTIADIAAALGLSKSQAERRAKTGNWPFTEEVLPSGGKRRMYRVDRLPAEIRDALAKRALTSATASVPMVQAERDCMPLKDWQKDVRDAQAALLAEIDRLGVTCGMSAGQSIGALVSAAKCGALSPDLARLVPVANARSGGAAGSRTLSRSSLYRWLQKRNAAGVDALAPKATPAPETPNWVQTFMRFYCIPTNPGMAEVLDHPMWPEDVVKPSYDQVRRYMKSVSILSKSRGRVGPRAMKAMMGYKLRDTAGMWPGCVFIGDGHTDKKLVAHPDSGRPFRAEVTAILDVYSRKWVGWSAALSENTWAVADALRHALTTTACCDIFYYDNGSGAKNKTWDDDCTGMTARLGITKLHSAPWSSQARGVIERFHSSVLHKVARRSPTYVGGRMDKEARQIIHHKIEADIKATGQSDILPSWEEFIAEIDAEMARYNSRPHDSLPKIVDAETGKRRHMSPAEMWAKGVAEMGLTGDPIGADEARSLFRPAVRRKVSRELVSFLGNSYHAKELAHLHGMEVMVAYDIHDANSVEISQIDGRWLCSARWNGHKTEYMPVSVTHRARETRLAGQLGRNDTRRQKILDAAGPTLAIEHKPETPLTFDQMAIAEAEFARIEAKGAEVVPRDAAPGGRPTFADDAGWARWVMDNPETALEADRRELRRKLQDRSFRMLLEMQGLDVDALSALAA